MPTLPEPTIWNLLAALSILILLMLPFIVLFVCVSVTRSLRRLAVASERAAMCMEDAQTYVIKTGGTTQTHQTVQRPNSVLGI